MSVYTYATTLQKPTAVHDAIKGNFLAPNDTNLIVRQVIIKTTVKLKGTRIEIYSFSNDLLYPSLDLDLYCRIASIKTYTLPNRSTCSLFVLSERQMYCVLHFDPVTKTIITEAHGTLEQKNARPNDEIMAVKDTENRVIIISAFTGLLFCIPLQGSETSKQAKGKGKEGDRVEFEPFEYKIQEYNIKSMVALEESSTPTFAIIYEQEAGVRLKFYQVKLSRRTIIPKLTLPNPLESSSHLLVPVPLPFGGVLVIGEYTIWYYDMEGNDMAVSIDAVMITTYAFIGGTPRLRCVLGDTMGTLYVLTLTTSKTQVTDLNIIYLGQVSACSCIVYLGFDMLYCGSSQGDSSLGKLNLKTPTSPLEIVDEYPNLAPITDFCLYDLDKQGWQTLVCCSGANNDASLRIVQSGIGFVERAVVPISDMTSVWSLKTGNLSDKSQHDILVLSTIRNTRILYHPGGDSKNLEELDSFLAFDLGQKTLYTTTLDNGDIIQITPKGIRLMRPKATMITPAAASWNPPHQVNIVAAAVGQGYCVVSCGLGRLICLEIDGVNVQLVEKKNISFPSELSCLNILDNQQDGTSYVAVGLWSGYNVQVLRLPTLAVVDKVALSNTVPRNILFQTLEGITYLFVAMGDGMMAHYTLTDGMKLGQRKMITLGTRSTSLYSLTYRGENVVFAASDRPTMISSARKRLVYSTVNLKDVKSFALFNNAAWPNSLLIMTEQYLVVGDFDPAKKLHISKLPLDKKMGRRIAYHDDTQTIAVGTCQIKRNYDNGSIEKHGWINIYDARTFQEIGTHDLLQHELVESMCTARIFNQNQLYLFVGTAITLPAEPERNIGRILMYQVNSGQSYQLVEAVNVPGVVYCIKPYKNSITATVNGSLYHLNSYRPEAAQGERLFITQKISSNVLALDLDTNEEHILVGDFMQSMSLVELEDETSPTMTTVAKDYNANWMTAVKMANHNTYIGAEMSHNLFTLLKPEQKEDAKKDETLRMDMVGEYHIGDLINRMHQGSLADEINSGTEGKENTWSIIYVTVNGAIGTLVGISEQDYMLLLEVQQNMITLSPPIGKMDHTSWRSFDNGTRMGEARGYIDGDLVEKFLALSTKDQHNLVDQLSIPISVDNLQIKIEGLSQLR
ncbi:CPSF A subunit region-domain-containing protein [Chlamydoabsidia padenii]|nr:CPSF A subunit region-domain-containing protein [Chlamydoabsidia padenii]